MMPVTLEQIADAVDGKLVVPSQVQVPQGPFEPAVVSDSRQAGAGSVFVAIPGEHVDGHDFVGKAAQTGAVAAIVEHVVDAPVAQLAARRWGVSPPTTLRPVARRKAISPSWGLLVR